MTYRWDDNNRIYPVILSGGAGTRLWPLSRSLYPKQMLSLNSNLSLLQETAKRIAGSRFEVPLFVCNEAHRFVVAEQLRELNLDPDRIVLESVGRNTAPAATIAALLVFEQDPDGVLLLLPSDHVVRDEPGFHAALASGFGAAKEGQLVTFGIKPSSAETGYGYIRRGPEFGQNDGCYDVDAFFEKPDQQTATDYLADGRYHWNSGMFMFSAAAVLGEIERLNPDLLEGCRRSVSGAKSDADFLRLDAESFSAIEAISFDYAIMERTDKAVVVPADIGWSDVGSWSALWDIGEQDENGNVVSGDAILTDTRNSLVMTNDKVVGVVGLDDVVIVATDDALIVAAKDKTQDVKKIVETLESRGRNEHLDHVKVHRPWGHYRTVNAGDGCQVKQIAVKPGEKISLQKHFHRSEHWVVVSGTAKVTNGEETFFLNENQSTFIPIGTIHALENPGDTPLRIIEVQCGDYLGEDDIVRYEDRYGRVEGAAE